MEKYIGTKEIKATPSSYFKFCDFVGKEIKEGSADSEGYIVQYPDVNGSYENAYTSFSPKDVFEKAYRKTNGLTFGLALEAAKQGKLIARQGWNGKGMFVFVRPSDELRVDFIVDKVKSLPGEVKSFFEKHFMPETAVKLTEYLCLKAADGSIMNGWIPNTLDLFAEDWGIVEVTA